MKNDIMYTKQFYDDEASFVTQLKVVLKWFGLAFICIVLVAMLFGLRIYGVVGWSMEPTFAYESLVFDIKYDGKQVYEIGDIITYYTGYDKTTGKVSGIVNTHRIVDKNVINGEVVYITLGDNPSLQANGKEGAQDDVYPNQILGKVITINDIVVSIPNGVKVINFFKNNLVDCILTLIAAYVFFEVAAKPNKYKQYEA